MVDTRLIPNIVAPQVFVGDCPQTVADIEHLKHQLSVTAVLTLQTDDDRRLYGLDWDNLRRAYDRAGSTFVSCRSPIAARIHSPRSSATPSPFWIGWSAMAIRFCSTAISGMAVHPPSPPPGSIGDAGGTWKTQWRTSNAADAASPIPM